MHPIKIPKNWNSSTLGMKAKDVLDKIIGFLIAGRSQLPILQLIITNIRLIRVQIV
jgi:hypothetical protein